MLYYEMLWRNKDVWFILFFIDICKKGIIGCHWLPFSIIIARGVSCNDLILCKNVKYEI